MTKSNPQVKTRGKNDAVWGPYAYMFSLGLTSLVASAVAVLLASATPISAAAFAASLAVIVVTLAASCVGGLAGFMFGVPKLLATQNEEPADAGSSNASGGLRRYVGNTNLESVSDWLTKAIIGVGLVELQEIPGAIWSAASAIAAASPGNPAVAIVAAMEVAGFLWGFAVVYLYARTDMLRAMTSAENDAGAASTKLDSLSDGVQAVLDDLEADDAADSEPTSDGEQDTSKAPRSTAAVEPEVEGDRNRRDRAYWARKAMEATDLLAKIPSPTPEQLRDVAAFCRLANWMDEASNIYQQLIRVNEGVHPLPPEDCAFPFEQLGHVAQQRKKYVDADGYFEQAFQKSPGNLHIVYARARNAALAGDDERAIRFLSEVIGRKPAFRARARRDHALHRIEAMLSAEVSESRE